MVVINEFVKEYGFKVIEDVFYVIGVKYKGNFVGSCDYFDIIVFSFYLVKIIIFVEGGMVVINCEMFDKKMKCLCSYGIINYFDEMIELSYGFWYY